MDDIKLLNVKDLAKRWGCDESSIRRYIAEGTITPCKGVPGIKFHPKYISELEGVELERFSPLEKKRLEKEIQELRVKNDSLKSVLANILSESSKVINM